MSHSQRSMLLGALLYGIATTFFLVGVSYPSFADPRFEPDKAAQEYSTNSFILFNLIIMCALALLLSSLFVLGKYLVVDKNSNSIITRIGIGLSSIGIPLIIFLVLARVITLSDVVLAYINFGDPTLARDLYSRPSTAIWLGISYFSGPSFVLGIAILFHALKQDGALPNKASYISIFGIMGWVLVDILPFSSAAIGYGFRVYVARLICGFLVAIGGVILAIQITRTRRL